MDRDYVEVGTSFAYPTSDYGFVNVTPIPEKMARGLLELAGIKLPYMWMNKMAYVINVDDWYGYLAVYKHDFTFWIIKRPYR